MTVIIDDSLPSWADLQNQTNWSSLLIGNGFSCNIWDGFGYPSLFAEASRKDKAHLSDTDILLFEKLQTKNFEFVLGALSISKMVAEVFGQTKEALDEAEESIRSALIQVVHSVHLPRTLIPTAHLERISENLSLFSSIYSTNYDLLTYWSVMERSEYFKDYFWSKRFDVNDTKIWGTCTKVHFLHGGLHLYRRPNGQTLKRSAGDHQNLLDLFATPFEDTVPLFISEGTAEEKLASIYRSDYLSFVISCFKQDTGPLVIFGHSLGESDQHIVSIIRAHSKRKVAISIRSEDNIREKKASYIKALPNAKIDFFNASTHPLGSADLHIKQLRT